MRSVIFVSLRMAANAEAPLPPISLYPRLQGMGGGSEQAGKCQRVCEKGDGECQRALTRKRTLGAGGAPEVSDLRLLEDGSERGGALASDVIVPQTARDRLGQARVSTGLRERGAGSRFERQEAYSSNCSVELPFRPFARAAPPSGPMLFRARL